ncbi:hypothetical protein HQS73_004564 [Salmonella enterica]|nr:hypothetical protein [Salmonella enterica subsp. arizonae]EFS7372589.1 hypothetical protein [Salmonella enterica]EHA8424800.1 hypothetical protein [Salmonella enterica subsp. arizonae serovar 41:z4,z23:-]EEP9814570.1 hypothetical protein [Salmonella enterica subsp. arizonae]EFV4531854.1 hypothetical protein [Salmonella enterica]
MHRSILDYENRIFFVKDKIDTSPAIDGISTSIEFAPAAIVLFTFRIYVAIVPYSTFPASSRR